MKIPWGSRTIELSEPDLRLCDKLCSECHTTSCLGKKDLAKSWTCTECGKRHNREVNQRKNVSAFYWKELAIHLGFIHYGTPAAKDKRFRDAALNLADKLLEDLVNYLRGARRSIESRLICRPGAIRDQCGKAIWKPRACTLDMIQMLDYDIREYVNNQDAAGAAHSALLLGQISFSLAVYADLERFQHMRKVNAENIKRKHRKNTPLLQQRDDLIKSQWSKFQCDQHSDPDPVRLFCELHLPDYLKKLKAVDYTSWKKMKKITALGPERIRQILRFTKN